jgi:hypothetical protein
MSNDLRSRAIRLAHANPELRPHLLPLLSGVEKSASDDYIQVGDLVSARSSKGTMDVTVVSVRPMRTGNYEVRLTTKEGRDFKFTAKGGTYSSNARVLTLIRRQNAGAVKDLSKGHAEREQARQESKEDFADLGRKAIDTFDPKPGDTVTIEYRGGGRQLEIVNGVNWKTGKVGIVKGTRMSREERYQMEVAFWHLNQLSGANVRPPLERDTRWIPAHQIVHIEKMRKPAGA